MRTGNKPKPPKCALGAILPATTDDSEALKNDAWHKHGMLIVSLADARLNWLDRAVVEDFGKRLYGKRGTGDRGQVGKLGKVLPRKG